MARHDITQASKALAKLRAHVHNALDSLFVLRDYDADVELLERICEGEELLRDVLGRISGRDEARVAGADAATEPAGLPRTRLVG